MAAAPASFGRRTPSATNSVFDLLAARRSYSHLWGNSAEEDRQLKKLAPQVPEGLMCRAYAQHRRPSPSVLVSVSAWSTTPSKRSLRIGCPVSKQEHPNRSLV